MENQDEERKPTPLLRRLLHKTVLCEPVRGDWGFGPALSVLVPLWCGIRGKGPSGSYLLKVNVDVRCYFQVRLSGQV